MLFRPNAGRHEEGHRRDDHAGPLRLGFVEKTLGDKPFLTGENFTVADAYLYVILELVARDSGLDISGYPKLTAFYERCAARALGAAGPAKGRRKKAATTLAPQKRGHVARALLTTLSPWPSPTSPC